jgi:acetylglutamate kinase
MKKETLHIIKVGGNIIDDDAKLDAFLHAFTALQGKKILVHGGGKLATSMADRLQIPQQMVNGRRITDKETLQVVTMVYAGLINKTIVARLQARSCHAIGLSGADGNVILAHKREGSGTDYGFAGDVDEVNRQLISTLLDQGLSIVMAPITHDARGQLLNTNADTIAQEMATALCTHYDVRLVFTFEKKGVLMDIADERSVIARIGPDAYTRLKAEQRIFAGMIPKLDNAFKAIAAGVSAVLLGRAEELEKLVAGETGTVITAS